MWVGPVKAQTAVIIATLTSISSNEREPKEKRGWDERGLMRHKKYGRIV